MTQFSHYMVDIETTGLSIDSAAIIQIAAVRFDLQTKEVDPDFFDQCLMIPPNRYWDEGTRNWWMRQPEVLEGIQSRARDPRTVLTQFRDWVDSAGMNPIFWSKPTLFDFPLLDSYFRQFEIRNPFHFRSAKDLRSFMAGQHFPQATPKYESTLEFDGDAHNALHDVFFQIKMLFQSCEDTCKS